MRMYTSRLSDFPFASDYLLPPPWTTGSRKITWRALFHSAVRVAPDGTGRDLCLMNIQADHALKNGFRFHRLSSRSILKKVRDGGCRCRINLP